MTAADREVQIKQRNRNSASAGSFRGADVARGVGGGSGERNGGAWALG